MRNPINYTSSRGSGPLVLTVTFSWFAIWLLTQVVVSEPLSTTPTILIGLGLTILIIVAYPSVIRGPRRKGGVSTSSSLSAERDDPLSAVSETVPFLQSGFAGNAAQGSVHHLLALTGGSAVAITNTKKVLGKAKISHNKSVELADGATTLSDGSVRALERGRTVIAETQEGTREVAAPLRLDTRTVGTIAVTYPAFDVPAFDRIEAVAGLVSLQFAIAELTEEAKLASDARLDALRAQINPHFLFNTLNTIAAKSRTDPNEARRLLQRLADFFRYGVQQEGQFAEFAHEYFFVRTYLSLEQARFDERLSVRYDIDPQVLTAQIPVLTIQPLVENAVKHGISPKPEGGTVRVSAKVDPLASSISIGITDDGIGMEADHLAKVASGEIEGTNNGVGFRNIHERLQRLYGSRYHLAIRSTPGKGTRIELDLPM